MFDDDVTKFTQLDIFIIPYFIPSLLLLELVNKFNSLIRHLLKILTEIIFIQMHSAKKGIHENIGFFCGCEAKSFFTFYRNYNRVSFLGGDLFEVFQNSFP